MQAAEAMALFLEQHGVELVAGQSLPSALHLALPQTGIRQIQVRTENAGTAICDAYARIAGKVAVMTAQNGPAATLLVPGLAEALKASVPIVAIVQEVNADQRDRNAFQECDHLALFAGCAKWVGRVENATRIYDYLNLALTQALTGRPGPAVLLVPADVLLQPAPPLPTIVAPRSAYPLDRVAADPEAIETAAALLAAAQRPLIVAGGGVHSSRACEQVSLLQQEFGIPVATTVMGKGAVDETRRLSLGVVGHVLGARAPNRASRQYLEAADLVFLVGTRTNQNGTDSWTQLPRDARFIHLDIDGVEVGRNYESFRLVGDARLTLEALIALLRTRFGPEAGTERAARLERQIAPRRALDACIPEGAAGTVRPERVVEAIDRLAPDDAILVADASYASVWLAAFGVARGAGRRFLTPRGLAGLGWGLPYMLGAKLARPSATVIGLCGDGGFAHVWSELETAARSGLAFVCIVLKNGVLGYQRDAELVKFGAHTNAIPIAEIDHAAIARACGCVGISVEAPGDLEGALEQALSLDRPVVLDLRTDPTAFPPVTLLDSLIGEPANAEA
ncbi:MAG: acetolactate synthase catalytic subunit [Alphaproteobacteria bacterium]